MALGTTVQRHGADAARRAVTRDHGFPLMQAADGERVEIVAVEGGRGTQRRLNDLGLVVGRQVEVVARQPGGPVLLALDETRIAVGFGLALKLRVRPTIVA